MAFGELLNFHLKHTKMQVSPKHFLGTSKIPTIESLDMKRSYPAFL